MRPSETKRTDNGKDVRLTLLRGDAPPPRVLPEIGLRGVGLHAVSESECVEHVQRELDAGRGGVIVTPNLDHLRRLLVDEEFRSLYDRADLRVADGMALIWASKLQRTPLPERVPGSNLVWSLSRALAEKRRSIFLLGGNPGTDVEAGKVLAERCPGLRVAGTDCPPMGFDKDDLALARLTEKLKAARPDLVFVALGSPKQERVIEALRDELPGTWWIGCGISFSFVCGEVERAPYWMQDLGLEWFHRFLQEPGRLFERYFVQGVPFAATLLVRSALRGMLPKGRRAFRYGPRRPRGLLLDDDVYALDHLELMLATHFPDVEFEKRQTPDVSGEFDFYFLDNDFDGTNLAGRLARKIRRKDPDAMIFALSGRLDSDTLKRLINAGCDAACDKGDPAGWRRVIERLGQRLREMVERHKSETGSFGGVRHAAHALHALLVDWNRRRAPRTVDSRETEERRRLRA